jgi:hypothetical protein
VVGQTNDPILTVPVAGDLVVKLNDEVDVVDEENDDSTLLAEPISFAAERSLFAHSLRTFSMFQ